LEFGVSLGLTLTFKVSDSYCSETFTVFSACRIDLFVSNFGFEHIF
jgi:hypothetical protein